MKPPLIPLEKITALEPVCLRLSIPDAYRDANGHMNMRWYLAIFDDAGEVLHERLGLTPEYHRERRTGTVDLEHLMFMVNESRGRLASIFECINAFMNAVERKTATFPFEIAERIAEEVATGASLDWLPPVCGAMRP